MARAPRTKEHSAPGPLQNQLGRKIRASGAQTRRRLLEATATLLDTTPLVDLRVAQIVRAVGTSQSTFYIYFEDVPSVVLALVGELTQSPPSLLNLFGDPWPAEEAYALAHEFAVIYDEQWRRHGAVYRVRNLIAEEGDDRFIKARRNAVGPLIDAIANRVEERRAAGEFPTELNARSAAGALLAMMERVAVTPLNAVQQGVSKTQLIHAAAFLIAAVIARGDLNAAWSIAAHGAGPDETTEAVQRLAATSERTARSRRSSVWRNLRGQSLGGKGADTRRRLVEIVRELICEKPLRDIRVADITDRGQVSTATFYLYFEDVSDAVLAAVSDVTQSPPHLISLLDEAEGGGWRAAQEFVHGYMVRWRDHGPLFRVRNLSADEGDLRFDRVRAAAIRPLLSRVEAAVARQQALGGLPKDLHALSVAGAFIAMIERMSASLDMSSDHAGSIPQLSAAAGYVLSVLLNGMEASQAAAND
jgi:AcrR family transcriptional regulator